MPTLSLIIVLHDQVHFLPPLLNSLQAQSFQDFEVILVDDASLKRADDVFSRFSETGLRLTLIRHEERRGAVAANIAGFEASGGRYVIFGAADGVFIEEALQKMLDAAETFKAEVIDFAPSAMGLKSGPEAAEKLLLHGLAFESETLALYNKMWARDLAAQVWPQIRQAGLKDTCDLCFNTLALPLAQKYVGLGSSSVFKKWDNRPVGSPQRDLESALALWRAAVLAPDVWAAAGLQPSSINALTDALRTRLSCVAGRLCGWVDSGLVEGLLGGKSEEELTDIFKMLAVAADCSAVLEGLRREKQLISEVLKRNGLAGEATQHRAPSPSDNVPPPDYSNLKKALVDERQKTEAIVGSLSWRITAPLRAAMRRLKNAPPAGDVISLPETDESPLALYKALDIERQKVKDLTASLSWRLTGPLRKILVAFGRPQPVISAGPPVSAPAKVQAPAAPVKAANKKAKYQYTVVSACYNVEKYLNDYFASLVNQSISFTDHIHLIMVDDGSTDGTAAIIKYWQSLYPENIHYLYQENAGQGAARNRGLELVTTPWVTFIDSDDFIDEKYFEIVDSFLTKNHQNTDPAKRVKLVACSFIFYIEADGSFRNTHPLSYKFRNKEEIIPFNGLDDIIHFAVNSSFYSVQELERQKLRFTADRWPLAEDAHFTVHYLEGLSEGVAAFLREANYFYRKRLALDSSMDLAGKSKTAYLDVIRGYDLEVLQSSSAKNNGYAPAFIQKSIFYDLSWKINALLNKPRPFFLSPEEARETMALMRQCFKFIDRRLIENYPGELSDFWFNKKVGTIACFKNTDPTFQIVYVKEYDRARRTLLLEYYCRQTGTMKAIADGGRVLKPLDVKNTPQTILDERFCYMVSAMLEIPKNSKYLNVNVDEASTRISLDGKQHHDKIEVSLIEKAFASPYTDASEEYEGAWVLMDRDTNADDNAEHLYRHIKNCHPEQKIFFGLRSSSPDWSRLKKEGFALLNYDTAEFAAALKGCATVISSHIDPYLTKYLPDMLRYKRFVFLQHGATVHNVSQWLNNTKVDLFITTTGKEHESIVANDSPYKYSPHKVKLTGFARHDALVPHTGEKEKLVAIIPTWRMSLVSPNHAKTNARTPIQGFLDSEYARAWGSFLKSDRLKELSNKYAFRVIFYPHINMQMYIKDFNLPDYIQLPSSTTGSIQEIFKKAAIMVSDYSSVMFEMAFLKKSALYYQFDREEVLITGQHICAQGYFDYCRDGFGPVAETEDVLLDELEKIMARGGEPEPVYLKRMEETFPWRDGNNCERIYQEILRLDRPLEESQTM